VGRLDGKVALITGGARGMGKSHVRHFVAEGARVVFGDVLDDRGAAVAAGLGAAACRYVHHDVTSEADWAAAVAAAVDVFGRLDVLVNNAGVGIGSTVGEIQTKHLDMQLSVNLRSIVIFYRECLSMLQAAGAEHSNALVVNTSSISGKRAEAWLSIYSATKHGVVGWTEAMNKELGSQGIKSTALCPAFVDTPMTDFVKSQVKAEEMIRPQDIAEAVRFMLRVSPACVVPEMMFVRPGDAL